MHLFLKQSVLNASFTKDDPTSPNIKNFTIDFATDDENIGAQHALTIALQSSIDVIMVSSLDDCNTNDEACCA